MNIPKAVLIKNQIIIYHKMNKIVICFPEDAIELGEQLIKLGEQMIHEQSHI